MTMAVLVVLAVLVSRSSFFVIQKRTDCKVGKKRKAKVDRSSLVHVNLDFEHVLQLLKQKVMDIDITPNNKDQDGKYGFLHAKFNDGKSAYVMMKDEDSMTITFKDVEYVRQICLWSFVIKSVTVTYYNPNGKIVYQDTVRMILFVSQLSRRRKVFL